MPCQFEIHLFGFPSDTADVLIDVHAPTGDGRVYTGQVTLAEGRGNEVSAVLGPIDLTSELVGTYEPHPQQGYHLKLYVDRQGSVGGAKQKVFWVECAEVAGVLGSAGVGEEHLQAAASGGTASVGAEVLGATETATVASAAPAQPSGQGPAVLAFTGAAVLALILLAGASIAVGTALLGATRPRLNRSGCHRGRSPS